MEIQHYIVANESASSNSNLIIHHNSNVEQYSTTFSQEEIVMGRRPPRPDFAPNGTKKTAHS